MAIGALPNLQVMNIAHNNLTGSIPSSMFSNVSITPPSLRIVQLGFNAFTDLISPNPVFFSVLQALDLQQNQIHGGFPTWLTNVSSLLTLDLSGNLFTGKLPAEIGGLVALQELRLANNSLSADIPTEIQKCSSLRVLDLAGNQFSGDFPAYLGELKTLRTLSLGRNQFFGSIAASFGNLVQLDTLNLRENNLTGNVPVELLRLSNLTTLDLSGNNFSGNLSSNIGDLKNLVLLNMSNCGFLGTIPGSVGSLLRLKSLDLSRQNLSGEVPFELSGLPNLQYIYLQENALSGAIPEGFSSLSSLRHLNLTSNAFSGEIPATYGFLQSLLVLSLSKNHISGFIPPELGNCSNLEVLQLGHNRLTGDIPGDLSRLSNLNELDLGHNNLSGEIPEDISKCTALLILSLDNNQINGSIPESISMLSNLTLLDLSANHLSGVIPQNITRLSGLQYFNVSRNNLEGEIPALLGSQFSDPSAYAMNPNLCGRPLARNCAKKSKSSSKRKKLILMIGVAIAGALLITLCCCGYIYSLLRWRKQLREAGSGEKKRSPARTSSGAEGGRGSGENGGPKMVMFNNKLTYAETVEATRQFDEENVLSRGRYGLLFKAIFLDGTVLSIRRLPDGSVEESVFRKEAEALGKVKHRNLTVLRGYYAGPPNVRLLVYDYMPNGNLATLLQEASHQDGHVLNWPMRHLIALGVARGLAFLHTCTMVHGDVKPQNVLFDADFEAHLSDFGLDKLTVSTTAAAEASTSTTAVGTVGYVAPEVATTAEMTKEADVYSFGIVLLELLTGKRPVMFNQDEEDIVKWVKKQLQKGQISELLEPGLLELDPESSEWEEFLLGVKVGLLCTAPDPLDRPSMTDIVFMLEGCRVGPDIPSSVDPTSHPSPA